MVMKNNKTSADDDMTPSVDLEKIMRKFADDTGITDDSNEPRRYLWTDAFAVCNFIELYRQTEKPEFLRIASKLVDQVHHVLGKNRQDNSWLSGLNDYGAKLHPTLGGLRIGKKLDERLPGEAFDDRLEWDRDGQYFHYLTKWMHALDCLSRMTNNGIYNQWAIELAKVAHAAFTYTPDASSVKKMVWKMSVDLKRPLVDSMGQHDPLDGLITYQQLEATAKLFPETEKQHSLETEIKELSQICEPMQWSTPDPLGIGGLLTDANRITQLIVSGQLQDESKLELLLRDINISMQLFIAQYPLNAGAESRLAFRELGLAIGICAIEKMQTGIEQHAEKFNRKVQLQSALKDLTHFQPVYDYIKEYWLSNDNRSVSTWLDHSDINSVMLATCLAPDSFLNI
jgi:hypothetical protein